MQNPNNKTSSYETNNKDMLNMTIHETKKDHLGPLYFLQQIY
jgi:hypothetical protein